MKESIHGNYVDILSKTINEAVVTIADGRIHAVEKINDQPNKSRPYILPGFIDAHIHIESSMLTPSEFARLAVVHGTVATVSDPHEIANVCGMKGVDYMIDNGSSVPFKFHFGAPSCVPATPFETAGAALDAEKVKSLLERKDIFYLSEMMNYPGVLSGDAEVMKKIEYARENNKPVDGHAPGLMGDDAVRYIHAGISTDHECFTKEEALNKLQYGMKILIREGSAAKNFEALIALLGDYEDDIMFCSDDKHPDSLVEGHINQLCRRAVAKGIDVFKVLKAACINPVKHYRMKVGRLRPGDRADLIVCKDLVAFDVMATYVDGVKVASNGKSLIDPEPATIINNFKCIKRAPEDFRVSNTNGTAHVIHAVDGQLITGASVEALPVVNGLLAADLANDVLKIAVINRYAENEKAAVAFIRHFGMKRGAIASSVAHDSHNIIVVGVDDESISDAVNLVIESKGGVSFADHQRPSENAVLPLPVAGLMSNQNGYVIAKKYAQLDRAAKNAGSTLGAPYMTLAFMALLVIPKLKLSDKGLFDGEKFCFVNN